jgi:hypothetical protein
LEPGFILFLLLTVSPTALTAAEAGGSFISYSLLSPRPPLLHKQLPYNAISQKEALRTPNLTKKIRKCTSTKKKTHTHTHTTHQKTDKKYTLEKHEQLQTLKMDINTPISLNSFFGGK